MEGSRKFYYSRKNPHASCETVWSSFNEEDEYINIRMPFFTFFGKGTFSRRSLWVGRGVYAPLAFVYNLYSFNVILRLSFLSESTSFREVLLGICWLPIYLFLIPKYYRILSVAKNLLVSTKKCFFFFLYLKLVSM